MPNAVWDHFEIRGKDNLVYMSSLPWQKCKKQGKENFRRLKNLFLRLAKILVIDHLTFGLHSFSSAEELPKNFFFDISISGVFFNIATLPTLHYLPWPLVEV